MSQDLSMYEWRKHKEFYTNENGKIVFRDDTPSHILESYQKECAQKEALDRFAKRKDQKAGFFSFKKKPTSTSTTSYAAQFLNALKEQAKIDPQWFSSRPILIGWDGQVRTDLAAFYFDEPIQFLRKIKDGSDRVVIGSARSFQFVLVLKLDRDGKIIQIEEYRARNLNERHIV